MKKLNELIAGLDILFRRQPYGGPLQSGREDRRRPGHRKGSRQIRQLRQANKRRRRERRRLMAIRRSRGQNARTGR